MSTRRTTPTTPPLGNLWLSLLSLGALGLFAALPSGPASASGEPSPAASSAPIASASAAASPSDLPTIKGSDIPAEASKDPKPDEWKSARNVQANRSDVKGCELSIVREWLRVSCEKLAGGGLVAGDPKGVLILRSGVHYDDANPMRVTIIAPLRRGQSHLFTLLDLGQGYDSLALDEGPTMSVLWREGQADPKIVLKKRF